MDYVDRIPAYTLQTIELYVTKGLPTGGFVHACLTNNLMGATGRADADNLRALPDICMYIYNRIPADAWGSEEKVAAWYKARREEGPLDDIRNRVRLVP